MKIKSTVWIACIVIPLALVLLLLRSQMNRMVAAEEAEQRAAGVAAVDRGTEDSSASKARVEDTSKTDSDAFREKPDTAAVTDDGSESGTSSVASGGGGSRSSSGRRPRREQPFEDVTHYFYPLKNQKALELGDALQKIYPKLRWSTILETNAVMLTGGTPQMDERMKAFVAYSEQSPEEKAKNGLPEGVREFLEGKAPEMLASESSATTKTVATPAIVTLFQNGSLKFQESAEAAQTEVTPGELARLVANRNRIVLQADKSVSYANMAQLLAMLREADNGRARIVLRELEWKKLASGSSNESNDKSSGTSNASSAILTIHRDRTLEWQGDPGLGPQPITVKQLADVVPHGSHVLIRVADKVSFSFVGEVLEGLRERQAEVSITALPWIPDLTGNWAGEGWGQIELRQTKPGVFEGTYTDTFGGTRGTIKLEWLAEDRRFHGEWKEGNGDRFGELTVRMTDQGNMILGTFSADAQSKINPGNPKLGHMQWTRVIPGSVNITRSGKSYNLPNDALPPNASAPANAQPGARYYPLVGVATLQAGDAPLTDAQRHYREAEEQARGHALGLSAKLRNPKELQSLKNTVTTAFDARQALLRQELADFRSRLDRLTKTLEARERDKDKIIQHRVEELLNPNLRWDATGNPRGGSTIGPAMGGSAVRPGTSSGVGSNSDSTLSGTLSTLTSAAGMGLRVTIPQHAARPKELEFLSQYPRFSSLSLDMTETQFRAFLEQQKLVPQLSIPRDGQLNYSIPLGDGKRLTVMFGLDGKCRGIEPMSGDAPSIILPQPAPSAPVRAEKVVAKIFRLEQVDAASVAKTLQELASEKPFSARISADAASNSVIVFANPDDMHVIEAIILRLDKALESPIPKAAPKLGDDSSVTPASSGTSNTANP